MVEAILITVGVMFIAAVLQGTAGFGFGLVALGLLALVDPIKHAAVINAVPALTVNAFLVWRLREHLRWPSLMPIAVATALATPMGVVILFALDARVMYGLLAAVLLATILRAVMTRGQGRPWHPLWLGGPMGVFSGLLAGAYGSGGPPLVAYIYSRNMPHLQHVVSIQLLLGIAGVIRVGTLVWGQSLTGWQWCLNGIGALAALAGAAIGVALLGRIPEAWLKRLVLAMLAGIMIFAAYRSVWPGAAAS